MNVLPYLFFDGRCEEAIEYYRSVLSAEVVFMMRFRESPDQTMVTPEMAEKIMHATLRIGTATVQMSDGRCGGKPGFEGFALSISLPDEAAVKRVFEAITSSGGQVQMPVTKTFWSPAFGMAADKFGVGWMVLTETAQ